MLLIPKDTEISNVLGESVDSQDFTVRVRAYSESDQWVVRGNESWSFHLNDHMLGLTVGSTVVEHDVRANLTHHMNDFAGTATRTPGCRPSIRGTSW
jgi:hypothetical protein